MRGRSKRFIFKFFVLFVFVFIFVFLVTSVVFVIQAYWVVGLGFALIVGCVLLASSEVHVIVCVICL